MRVQLLNLKLFSGASGLFFVLIFNSGCATMTPGPTKEFNLTLLHTNDVHARLLPINAFDQTCDDREIEKQQCFGGVARRFSKIEEIRKKEKNVLLVDAGDQFQGTLFYTRYKNEEAKQFMNRLGYAAMAIGNHEFDDGPTNLARFIKGVNFPVLSANLDVSQEPFLAELVKPYTVVTVGDEQIGIIGCTTEETSRISSPGFKVQFLPIEASLQKVVDELHKKNIKRIILLSHSGFMRDIEIAKKVKGLDVIVAGHSNTFLSNMSPLAEGPYPFVVSTPSGNPILIVSAYAYGKYLGYLNVTFNDAGRVIAYHGEPILLDGSVLENVEVRKEVQELEVPLKKMRREIVAVLPINLEGGSLHCRHEECGLGDVLSDAMLDVAKHYGARAVLMNGGGIRTGLAKGPVTRWQILDAVPFLNEIVVFDLTGKDLWDLVEFGVNQSENKINEGAARFLQVAGLHYIWSPKKTKIPWVSSIEIQSSNGVYESVLPNKIYRLAANRFMLIGGDGFEILVKKTTKVEILSETLDEALIAYLQKDKNDKFQTLGKRIVKN
jgi:5'-nucleotidase / UDP-sugar diphosphatase